jgi:hypothetical protein
MLSPHLRSRGTHTQSYKLKRQRPGLEALEARLLLYSHLGDQWTYSSRITYSFMPDGTNVGGTPSALFQTLNAKFPTAQWQQQIEAAASLWENATNANLALVPDGGQPVGVSGNQQDDPRFGDIRIGAVPLSGGVLAVTFVPPPANGGTDAGDILFNSNINWQINSNYDLLTVAAHEFGHALGLGESSVSTAVMYGTYNGIKQALVSDDISGIQSIYGTRQFDQFNTGSQRNNTYMNATNINSFIINTQIAIPSLDITTPGDSEWYFVNVPSSTTGTMSVSVQSSNLSSLSPKLQVYNSSLGLVGQASAPSSMGATVTVGASVQAGQAYYLKVLTAGGPGPIGGYGLLVNFGSQSQPPIPPPNTVVPQQPDQGGGTINAVPIGSPGSGPYGLFNVVGTLNGWVDALSCGVNLGGSNNAPPLPTDQSNQLAAQQAVIISIGGTTGSPQQTGVAQTGTVTGAAGAAPAGTSPTPAVLQAIDQAINEANLLGDES